MEAAPNIETAEPMAAKLRRDSEAPIDAKFNTDIAEPRRAKLRNDSEDPSAAAPYTDKVVP